MPAALSFSAVFDRILFILAGKYDLDKSLDEFKIWQDPTPDHFFSAVFHLIHFILTGNDDMHESSED